MICRFDVMISALLQDYHLHMGEGFVSVTISASLSISIASGALMVRACRLDHLCVCVRKVYCGKTAD